MHVVFFDTETTGIQPKTDYIVEIAAYDPIRDQSFESLVKPPIPIPVEASNVHGITDDMVANAPTFAEVGMQFAQFCSEDALLIAHNNDAFDVHFLRIEFSRHNIALPQWKYLDTLKWARKYRPDLPRHALQFLREIYGVEKNNAHRALDDVIVLHQVLEKMKDDLDYPTIYELMQQGQQDPNISTMPFGKHQGIPLEQVPKSYLSWLQKSGALDKEENNNLRKRLVELELISA
jgi:DNA polymerase-3 subunit epsilon